MLIIEVRIPIIIFKTIFQFLLPKWIDKLPFLLIGLYMFFILAALISLLTRHLDISVYFHFLVIFLDYGRLSSCLLSSNIFILPYFLLFSVKKSFAEVYDLFILAEAYDLFNYFLFCYLG